MACARLTQHLLHTHLSRDAQSRPINLYNFTRGSRSSDEDEGGEMHLSLIRMVITAVGHVVARLRRKCESTCDGIAHTLYAAAAAIACILQSVGFRA